MEFRPTVPAVVQSDLGAGRVCRLAWALCVLYVPLNPVVAPYVSPVAHGPRGGLYPLRLTGRMRSLSVTSPTLAGRDG